MSDLKPCPFCGENNNLWRYISPFSALIECGKCGVKLPGSEVRTVYRLENDPVPELLKDLVTKAETLLDKHGNRVTTWWAKPTDSFSVFGHIERWNTRALESKLAKAVETLEWIGDDVGESHYISRSALKELARKALSEIKGE